ncbi:MAG: TetR/AcrR family transcriptional regulator [Rhodoglobus sp.]
MVDAAIDALRHEGLSGMSFTDIVADSGVARGAIYHHFPGGKRQLALEAAELNGQEVLHHLSALSGDSPRDVAEKFVEAIRPVVAESASGSGCAVAAVTVGSQGNDRELRAVANQAFTAWASQLGSALTTAGMEQAPANSLATLFVTVLEGAHVLCRAAESVEPFEASARSLLALVAEPPTNEPSQPKT